MDTYLPYLNKAHDAIRIVLQGEPVLLIPVTVLVTNCKGLELLSLADDCIGSQDAGV